MQHIERRANGRISEERLHRALVFMAYLITRDGPVYMPIFERLERELEEERRRNDPMDRAHRLLDQMQSSLPASGPVLARRYSA